MKVDFIDRYANTIVQNLQKTTILAKGEHFVKLAFDGLDMITLTEISIVGRRKYLLVVENNLAGYKFAEFAHVKLFGLTNSNLSTFHKLYAIPLAEYEKKLIKFSIILEFDEAFFHDFEERILK